VLTLVAAGSKYETREQSGLSHFLEHMCFKGTTKRPAAMDITYELDSLGAQANAFTGQEYTGYYAKSDVKHTEQILDIVADVYQNSTFPEGEIEKEKGVIIEEINMYGDMPDEIADENLQRLMYGDTPAGRSIAGDIPTVKKMTRADFIKYHRKYYTTDNTVIVISGGIDEKIIPSVKKAFIGVIKLDKNKKPKTKDIQNKKEIIIKKKDTQQTHLVIGFRGYDMYRDDEVTASVLASVLGSGMSSRLFQKLREEMGVCYYVRAHHESTTDTGVFKIAAGVTHARTSEVVGVLLDECRKLVTELVPEAELQKVRDMIRGRMVLGLESSNSFAMYYGGQVVHDKPLQNPEEKLRQLEKINAKDLQKIAKKIFTEKRMNISIVGPSVKEVEIKKVFHI
jgi:predicted Zn-dependent peptidase